MRFSLLMPCLLFPGLAMAQDDVPGPPAPELADPEQHTDAAFGTDVSVTIGGGAVLGDWSVPGVHSTVGLRFDAFMAAADTPGPRLGMSIFGEQALGLLPHAQEDQDGQVVEFPFQYSHFGALCVLRSDPALPWGGNAGLGFSRLDLEPYYGGALPLPVMLFEGGARRALGGSPAFVDLGLRAGWTQLRNPAELLEDLWTVQLSLGIGAHVR
jgi:hypothetical protein